MGLVTNEDSGNALIINEKGNLQDKDGNTYQALEDVTITNVSEKEAQFGKMYICEFAEIESGELYKVYLPERYFNSFGQRALLFKKGDPMKVKPWRIEAKKAKGVKVYQLEDEGYTPVDIENVKQQTANLSPWEEGKSGWDSSQQSQELFDFLVKMIA